MSAEELLGLADNVYHIYVDGLGLPANQVSTFADISELMEAILADCNSGAMVQYAEYHYWDDDNIDSTKYDPYLEIAYTTPDGGSATFWITVYDGCVNTLAWLHDSGLLE